MIDYQKLADSVTYYEGKGFRRIESPWTVTRQVSEITKPAGKKEFALAHEDGKVLVASGEQSFLYLYLKGFLPLGQYQTITPCFRHEAFDQLHTKYFVKNELIETQNVSVERLMEMIIIAKDFFSRYFPEKELEIEGDGISPYAYDITYRGIELGSYGIRSCDFVEWIYATGLAEPRVSTTIKMFELAKKESDRINQI